MALATQQSLGMAPLGSNGTVPKPGIAPLPGGVNPVATPVPNGIQPLTATAVGAPGTPPTKPAILPPAPGTPAPTGGPAIIPPAPQPGGSPAIVPPAPTGGTGAALPAKQPLVNDAPLLAPSPTPSATPAPNPSIPAYLQNIIKATQSPGGAGPAGALATPGTAPKPAPTGATAVAVPGTLGPNSPGTITAKNLPPASVPVTQPPPAQPAGTVLPPASPVQPATPALGSPAAGVGPLPGLPGPATPGGTPASTPPSAGGASLTPFGPDQSLQFNQITPGSSAATTGALTEEQQAAQRVANGPDLQKAAGQEYQALLDEAQPAFQQQLRQTLESAAAGGRMGSGLTTSELGDVALREGKYESQLAEQLAGQEAPAAAQQNVSNLSALGGVEGSLAGQDVTKTNQLMAEQGYEAGQAQQGVQNEAEQTALQDQLLNSEYARQMGESQLGLEGAGLIAGEGQAETGAAAQMLGTAGLTSGLASIYGSGLNVPGYPSYTPSTTGPAPGATGAVGPTGPGAGAPGQTGAQGGGPPGTYYDPASGQYVDQNGNPVYF